MPVIPCLVCGVLSREGRCPRHRRPRNPADVARGSGGRRASFRRKTLKMTNGACAICGSRHAVQAHHPKPVHAGGGEDRVGIALCKGCHARADAAIRARERAKRG